MAYMPTNSDATAVATDTVARLNTSPSPNVGAVLGDALVALQDSMLCSTGTQGHNAVAGLTGAGDATTSSTTFVDIGNGSTTGFTTWSFTPSITKTYLVIVSVSTHMSVRSNSGFTDYQLVVGANTYAPADAFNWFGFANDAISKTFHVLAPMVAGVAVTLKLQWKVRNVGDVANCNNVGSRAFTVTG